MGIPIIGDIVDAVKDLASEVIVDKDKRNELNLRLKELEDKAEQRIHEQVLAQSEINKVEASNGSVFVAGWRPFIGWVGGAGLAWSFVVGPLVEWVSRLFGWTGAMPELDMSQLITIVLAMLGVGTMRTVEKIKGVSTNDYTDVPGRVDTKKAEAPIEEPPPAVKKKKKFKLF